MYSSYESVLEYLPDTVKPIRDDDYTSQHPLFKVMESFCDEQKRSKFIVSLSGGVDSMVILSVLHYLKCNVVALHINYNNREESLEEQRFIEEWCSFNKIPIYIESIDHVKRGTINRNNYETITRNIRFDFYKKIMEIENGDNIILGHHQDDIVENIFTNMMRARCVMDLCVMKESSVISEVPILRPILSLNKENVFSFAYSNNIPFFKDTTPSWSVRGKYRNQIYPMIQDTFGDNVKKNLLCVNNQMDEWSELINTTVVQPFMDTCSFHKEFVGFPLKSKYPLTFWKYVFMKIFFQYRYNCPSQKGIQTFLQSIQTRESGNIPLSKNCICSLNNNYITIYFI